MFKPDQLRLWLAGDKTKLFKSFEEIAEAPVNDKPADAESKIQENSGVAFPGDSLEPYVNSTMKLEDAQIGRTEFIVIEVSQEKFAFKY